MSAPSRHGRLGTATRSCRALATKARGACAARVVQVLARWLAPVLQHWWEVRSLEGNVEFLVHNKWMSKEEAERLRRLPLAEARAWLNRAGAEGEVR